MGIISVDLGTTNIKAAAYTDDLVFLALESHAVVYERDGDNVEFDAEDYVRVIVGLIAACFRRAADAFGGAPVRLVFTGQAESLVVVGRDGLPLGKAISWLDMRSRAECAELSAHFDPGLCYAVTGQPEIIPTWPLTKILWIKRNQAERFAAADKFLLLKDYVLYRLTGKFAGEHSIYPFSHYFDITKKRYWREPLDYCGVRPEQLPELVPPCSVVGGLTGEALAATGLPPGSDANAGTLDHFAGMIGSGNVGEGMVSESAGTVSSIAVFAARPFASPARIPLYCGPFENSYIYLPVCESGGISLEWFRNAFARDLSFRDIDLACSGRGVDPRLVFLPYLTGVNPPEFDHDATGVFYGAAIRHDRFDFALAIMYGVACLLRRNIDFFREAGIAVDRIVTSGGGAKSALWSQIKADVCGLPVAVPENQETPCLGAAIVGAVTAGGFPDYASAIGATVRMERAFEPAPDRAAPEEKYRRFRALYQALSPLFREI